MAAAFPKFGRYLAHAVGPLQPGAAGLGERRARRPGLARPYDNGPQVRLPSPCLLLAGADLAGGRARPPRGRQPAAVARLRPGPRHRPGGRFRVCSHRHSWNKAHAVQPPACSYHRDCADNGAADAPRNAFCLGSCDPRLASTQAKRGPSWVPSSAFVAEAPGGIEPHVLTHRKVANPAAMPSATGALLYDANKPPERGGSK